MVLEAGESKIKLVTGVVSDKSPLPGSEMGVFWVCVMPSNALVAVKDNMVLCLVAADELYAMTASGIESTGWTVVETLENNM